MGGSVGGDQRRRVEGNAIPYKGLTIAGNGAVRVQGDALCGRARRTGSASGVDRHGAAAVDVVAITSRRVAAKGRRVEVEGGVTVESNVDASTLEREERERRIEEVRGGEELVEVGAGLCEVSAVGTLPVGKHLRR